MSDMLAATQPLQWGRAYSARRTVGYVKQFKPTCTASMGPGLFSPEDDMGILSYRP